MSKQKIIFRADGHSKMGLGHVIRSLALADMLKEEFDVYFCIRNPLPTLKEQILGVCKEFIELPDTEDDIEEAKKLAQEHLTGNEIVVLDGYHFITEYQKTIKDRGCKLVCIDDIHAYHFVADVVINHAPGIDKDKYSIEDYTQLFLGLDYALLRKPFLEAARKRREIDTFKNIFICFGGSDFNNVTLNVLKSIVETDIDIEVVSVVLGGANQNKIKILDYVKNVVKPKIVIHSNLSEEEMCALMEKSQLAIVPASSILYEVVAVKMPVISGYYVENQLEVHNGFKKLGLISSLEDFNDSENVQSALSSLIMNIPVRKLIDEQEKTYNGQSLNNFLKLFDEIKEGHSIVLRRAMLNDMKLYFEWANDELVRKNAISSDPIIWENHKNWFSSRILKPDTAMYVFESRDTPFGQVRFDIKDRGATIDYSIDQLFRGKGLGKEMLRKGIETFIEEYYEMCDEIVGVVKVGNIPSAKVFQALDFSLKKNKTIHGEDYFVFSKLLLKNEPFWAKLTKKQI